MNFFLKVGKSREYEYAFPIKRAYLKLLLEQSGRRRKRAPGGRKCVPEGRKCVPKNPKFKKKIKK